MTDGIFGLGTMEGENQDKDVTFSVVRVRVGSRDRIRAVISCQIRSWTESDAIWTYPRWIETKISAHYVHFTWPSSLLNADTSSLF
jgi:hypothetical protein